MVVTEALARGIPVVVSDVGGTREALGTTDRFARPGLLVPPGTSPRWPPRCARGLPTTAPATPRGAAAERRRHVPVWDATVTDVDDALSDGVTGRSGVVTGVPGPALGGTSPRRTRPRAAGLAVRGPTPSSTACGGWTPGRGRRRGPGPRHHRGRGLALDRRRARAGRGCPAAPGGRRVLPLAARQRHGPRWRRRRRPAGGPARTRQWRAGRIGRWSAGNGSAARPSSWRSRRSSSSWCRRRSARWPSGVWRHSSSWPSLGLAGTAASTVRPRPSSSGLRVAATTCASASSPDTRPPRPRWRPRSSWRVRHRRRRSRARAGVDVAEHPGPARAGRPRRVGGAANVAGLGSSGGVAAWAFAAAGLGASAGSRPRSHTERSCSSRPCRRVVLLVQLVRTRRPSPAGRPERRRPPCLSGPTRCSAAACPSTATSTTPPEERLVLSNDADLDRVDAVRAGCDAILVGAGTVRADNPRLLVRGDPAPRPAPLAAGLAASPTQGDRDPASATSTRGRFFTSRRQREPRLLRHPRPAGPQRLATVATVVDAGPDADDAPGPRRPRTPAASDG